MAQDLQKGRRKEERQDQEEEARLLVKLEVLHLRKWVDHQLDSLEE